MDGSLNSKRRALLKATALLSSLRICPEPLARMLMAEFHEPTLAAFLDTLLPAGHGPGASDVGLGRALLAATRDHDGYREFLIRGMRWLDSAARNRGAENFAAASLGEREAIVRSCERAAPDAFEHRLFVQLHHDAFTLFYTDPRSWQGLRYGGPPQPAGFPDYAKPPSGKTE